MRCKVSVFLLIMLFCFAGNAGARLNDYLYPCEVSHLDWYLLTWLTAWRGSTIPAGPFVLDRMHYDRETRKIEIFVTGKVGEETDDNLQRSIEGISEKFQDTLREFDPVTDLKVYYDLEIFGSDDTKRIIYEGGEFVE